MSSVSSLHTLRARVLPRVHLAGLFAVLAALLAGACTSSSVATATGPSPVKCAVSLSMPSTSLDASGGSGSLTVSTDQECAWTVSDDTSWITDVSPPSGQGEAQVQFKIAPNPDASARQGHITVNGQTLEISQQAAACRFQLSPGDQSIGVGGGSGTFSVAAASGCAWTAKSDVSWISVTDGASGTGNGKVTIQVAGNDGAPRSGTVTVASQKYTVNQAATCLYTVAPMATAAAAAGASGVSVTVTTGAGCMWTAASNVPWIAVASGTAGTGNGSVVFNVAGNSGVARTGTLTIAGDILTVNQAAAPSAPPPTPTPAPVPTPTPAPAPAPTPTPCSFALNSPSVSPPSSGATGISVSVSTGGSCSWTAVSNAPWISITSGASGSGNGFTVFNVAANSGTARTGTLTIAGQTFTVSQAAVPAPSCSFSIGSLSASPTASGATGISVSVSTGGSCSWTAVSNAPWISITSGASGTGNGFTVFNVGANTGSARTGTLTIAGQTFTVNQGSGCVFSINPMSRNVGKNGANQQQVTVTTDATCGWTATSHASWLTITAGSSGTGPGTVTYSVASNKEDERTGTLTIAGKTYTVTQDEK